MSDNEYDESDTTAEEFDRMWDEADPVRNWAMTIDERGVVLAPLAQTWNLT